MERCRSEGPYDLNIPVLCGASATLLQVPGLPVHFVGLQPLDF